MASDIKGESLGESQKQNINHVTQPFDLEQTDTAERFNIPDDLYGRDDEIALFADILKQASFGSTELILLYGLSGIGKTSLVNKRFRPLAAKEGFFASGKSDQLERHLPYEPFIQAFQGLIRQLLMLPEQDLEPWREKLIQALGADGAVITEVIPELEIMIGEQKPVEDLPSVESERRFRMVFRRFVQVFRNIDPLFVLFLDDLQWADQSSVRLMHTLLSDPNGQGFIVIASFRDQEIGKHHPLLQMYGLHEAGVGVHRMPLSYLSMSRVHQLISDTLSCPTDKCESLSHLLFQKTAGEPFYLIQVLQKIHQDGWLTFTESDQTWSWNEEWIRSIQGRDDVIQYMESKINQLSENTRKALSFASCLGNQFSSVQLTVILKLPDETIKEVLVEAVREGLLIPLEKESSGIYQFFHDRIQQAAYALLSEHKREFYHLKIGHYQLSTGHSDNEVNFETIDHLNKGKSLLTNALEIDQLARLNDEAGKKAKQTGAFELARQYFHTGAELITEDQWESEFDFCFHLYLEWSECEYLCSRHEQADILYEKLLGRARTWSECAKVYCKQVIQRAHQTKYAEAISIGTRVLEEVGIRIPREPRTVTVMADVWRTKRRMPASLDRLKNLPEARDEKIKMVMELMSHMIEPSFTLNKSVYAMIVAKFIRLILKYGCTPVAPSVFSAYSVLLTSELKEYQKGYEVGKVAVEMAETSGIQSIRSPVYVMFGAICCRWVHHGNEGIPYLKKAIGIGLSSGDYIYTKMAIGGYLESIYTRAGLNEIERAGQRYLDTLEEINDSTIVKNATMMVQFCRCLRGLTNHRFSLNDEDFDEDKFLSNIQDDQSKPLKLFRLHTYKLQIYYLNGEYEKAVTAAEKAYPFTHLVEHLTHLSEFYFYVTLAMTCGLRNRQQGQRNGWMKTIKRNLRRFRRWAQSSSGNFAHKEQLITAELHRLRGEEQTAAGLYDQAIASANEQGFYRNAAIANELAGRFYLHLGREKVATVYLKEAHQGYHSWGAQVKTELLEKQYPDFFILQESENQVVQKPVSEKKPSGGEISSQNIGKHEFNFDLATIMKATQSLSQEMDLDKVLRQLMLMMTQNAGAAKGALIMERDKGLFVDAVVEKEEMISSDSFPLHTSQSLSKGIVRYVARTKKPLLLENACLKGDFTDDTYVKQNKSQSILCLPLMMQGRLNGLLYLENKWIAGLFHPDEIEVLQTLASQALFVKKLLSSHDENGSHRSNARKPSVIGSSKESNQAVLLESLTVRELDILNLIAVGKTNQEIAKELGLKIATVKVHNRNIYSKLNVNRRMKAVEHARELNLIKG